MFAPLLVRTEITLENVRKEKQFQDHEHDKELNENDRPEGTSPCHGSETIVIEKEDSFQHVAIVV
jgi:hypothetical protein